MAHLQKTEALSRGWIYSQSLENLQQRPVRHHANSGHILLNPDEFTWIYPPGFRHPPLRTVAATITCRHDGDDRRAFSMPAEFEALDALGFVEGVSDLPFCVQYMQQTWHKVSECTPSCAKGGQCLHCTYVGPDVVLHCQSLVSCIQSADPYHQCFLLEKAVHNSSQSLPLQVSLWK